MTSCGISAIFHRAFIPLGGLPRPPPDHGMHAVELVHVGHLAVGVDYESERLHLDLAPEPALQVGHDFALALHDHVRLALVPAGFRGGRRPPEPRLLLRPRLAYREPPFLRVGPVGHPAGFPLLYTFSL